MNGSYAGRRTSLVAKLKAIAAGDAFAAEVERLLHTAAELNGRMEWFAQRLGELDAQAGRWKELEAEMPALLHAVSVTTGALRRMRRDITDVEADIATDRATTERLAASIAETWTHLRVVRAEILHEVRSGAGPRDTAESVQAKVMDQDRVDALAGRGALRLNLGCGHLALEEYVNVDMRPLPGVDVVAPLDDLPFPEATVGEVFSAHVLEHFTTQALSRRLLPYWRSLIEPGGTFRAVVPDASAMAQGLAAGEVPFEDFAAVLMGGQEYEGDFHFTAFSASTLTTLLDEAGFENVQVVATARRNDIALELEVSAVR